MHAQITCASSQQSCISGRHPFICQEESQICQFFITGTRFFDKNVICNSVLLKTQLTQMLRAIHIELINDNSPIKSLQEEQSHRSQGGEARYGKLRSAADKQKRPCMETKVFSYIDLILQRLWEVSSWSNQFFPKGQRLENRENCADPNRWNVFWFLSQQAGRKYVYCENTREFRFSSIATLYVVDGDCRIPFFNN